MKKVAIYLRVGQHNQLDSALETQEKRVQDYCESKGYVVCDSASVVGDRMAGYPALLNMLGRTKDTGAETVVLASTKTIAATVTEMMPIKKALEEAGVSLEAIDGTHHALEPGNWDKNVLASMLAVEGEPEQVLGYEIVDGCLSVNGEEADIVKYVFVKDLEYSEKPPDLLVQEVIDEFARRGEEITTADAAKKVRESRILQFIDEEVKEKWPDLHERMGAKAGRSCAAYVREVLGTRILSAVSSDHTAVLNDEMWEAAQAKEAANPDAEEGQVASMAMRLEM